MEIKDQECKEVINKKDYYQILNLSNSASEEEIRKSYKRLAMKFHPDKNGSSLASEAFKKVSHAFSVLSHKEKKANYDKYGTEEVQREQYDDTDPFVFSSYFYFRTYSICFSI